MKHIFFILSMLFALCANAQLIWDGNNGWSYSGPNVPIAQSASGSLIYPNTIISETLPSESADQPLVRAVHDVDSYKIESFITEWVRLQGVDGPEIISNHITADQPFGRAFGDSVRNLIKGKSVVMTTYGKDNLNRTLVTIEIQGRDLGEIILERGWGIYVRNDLPLKQRRKYQRLRDYAKRNKLGVWSDPNMVTPAEWRKTHWR